MMGSGLARGLVCRTNSGSSLASLGLDEKSGNNEMGF